MCLTVGMISLLPVGVIVKSGSDACVAGPYHEDMRRHPYFDRMYPEYDRYEYERRYDVFINLDSYSTVYVY